MQLCCWILLFAIVIMTAAFGLASATIANYQTMNGHLIDDLNRCLSERFNNEKR